MQYKVVPFVAALDQKKIISSDHVAQQLEQLVTKANTEGWEYVRIESVHTRVAGDNGCFGFGAKPGYSKEVQVVVFQKK